MVKQEVKQCEAGYEITSDTGVRALVEAGNESGGEAGGEAQGYVPPELKQEAMQELQQDVKPIPRSWTILV